MKSKTLSFLAAFAAMTALSFAQEPAPAEAAAPAAPAEAAAPAAPAAPEAAKTSALAAVAAEIETSPDTDVAATTEASAGWLDRLTEVVNKADDWVWGPTLIGAILVTGILLTCILRFVHLFNLRRAFRYTFLTESDGHGEVTSFGALCTALSATIGTGNIVGVATAIGTGGPGALFWMEVAAFFGMATKYAEGTLAVRYREVAPDGKVLGGPFYYIEKGLGKGWKWLAVLFAVFGVVAGIMGIGTITQIQGITSASDRFFQLCVYKGAAAPGFDLFGAHYSWALAITGLVVTACVGLVVIGGLKRIASVSTVVVPFMAVFYVLICAFLLLGNLSKVSAALELIVKAAFNPQAFTGGMGEDDLAQVLSHGTPLDGAVDPAIAQVLLDAARARGDASPAALSRAVKHVTLTVRGLADTNHAQVTRGGLAVEGFSPRTLQSKVAPGLFAAGEALDVDGACGGFNLSWAWASGMVAGAAAAR